MAAAHLTGWSGRTTAAQLNAETTHTLESWTAPVWAIDHACTCRVPAGTRIRSHEPHCDLRYGREDDEPAPDDCGEGE